MPSKYETELVLQLLLKVSASWSPPEGMLIKNQYGAYVEAEASEKALADIERDPKVLSYEKNLSTGRFY